MAQRLLPSLSSFGDITQLASPEFSLLHPPPPPLPEGVLACGARHNGTAGIHIAAPAVAEHLIVIHLRAYRQLSVKIARWHHIDVGPGHVTIVPRGQPTKWVGQGGAEALALAIPHSFISRVAAQDAETDGSRIELVERIAHDDAVVHGLGLAVLNELRSYAPHLSLLETVFRALTVHLLHRHAVVAPKQAKATGRLSAAQLATVREYIVEHIRDELSLERLAACIHLSPYHFAHKFKEVTGRPPHQYVLHLRVQAAHELLLQGGRSIGEVARLTGFANQDHLARHIKRELGFSPRSIQNTPQE